MTTIHATEHGRHQGWVDKHPQSHIHEVERWVTNRADRVIACSYYMREQIADIFGVADEKVVVIPNGIDPDDLQPQDGHELRRLRLEFAAPDERLVLLIGRLVYEKGFQLALEAMPSLIERLPSTRFLVAGSGTHEPELRRQAERLGLMRHGTFLGWIGDDVLHSLYRIAAWSPSRRWRPDAPASSPTPAGSARSFPTRRPDFGSGPVIRARWAEWWSACSQTPGSATTWLPRRPSTCSDLTGRTSRRGRRTCTPNWSRRRSVPRRRASRPPGVEWTVRAP